MEISSISIRVLHRYTQSAKSLKPTLDVWKEKGFCFIHSLLVFLFLFYQVQSSKNDSFLKQKTALGWYSIAGLPDSDRLKSYKSAMNQQ